MANLDVHIDVNETDKYNKICQIIKSIDSIHLNKLYTNYMALPPHAHEIKLQIIEFINITTEKFNVVHKLYNELCDEYNSQHTIENKNALSSFQNLLNTQYLELDSINKNFIKKCTDTEKTIQNLHKTDKLSNSAILQEDDTLEREIELRESLINQNGNIINDITELRNLIIKFNQHISSQNVLTNGLQINKNTNPPYRDNCAGAVTAFLCFGIISLMFFIIVVYVILPLIV